MNASLQKQPFIIACLLLIVLSGCSSKTTDDIAAIKALLEKESATWRSGDVKAHAACWSIKPYSRILVSLPSGKTIDIPPQAVINPQPGSMGNGGTSVNSNYSFGINGNMALVSHNEESTAKDGTKTHSYEMRTLEKIAGDWKLVAQSIHIYQ